MQYQALGLLLTTTYGINKNIIAQCTVLHTSINAVSRVADRWNKSKNEWDPAYEYMYLQSALKEQNTAHVSSERTMNIKFKQQINKGER